MTIVKSFSFLIFGLFLLNSCGNKIVFEQIHSFEKENWAYQDTLNFDFHIPDTTKIYKLDLVLEHSIDYAFQNLYVKIHTAFPKGERITEMVSLELANKGGLWNGDRSGNYCKAAIPIQPNAYFNQAGDYTITIEQYMRKDPLAGLKKLTFLVEDTGFNR